MTLSARCSLDEAALKWGAAVPCAGNLPVAIDDPGFAWFIESGTVDLFLIERRDGVEQSAPQHLLRAVAGRLLPGVAPLDDGTALLLVAKACPVPSCGAFPLPTWPPSVTPSWPSRSMPAAGRLGHAVARRRISSTT